MVHSHCPVRLYKLYSDFCFMTWSLMFLTGTLHVGSIQVIKTSHPESNTSNPLHLSGVYIVIQRKSLLGGLKFFLKSWYVYKKFLHSVS